MGMLRGDCAQKLVILMDIKTGDAASQEGTCDVTGGL